MHPPLLPSTTAGPTALTVRIVPQSDPDDVGSSETTLQVGPTYTRRLHMLQPALRARRTAVYEMMLENQGNTQASCRLHLLDPTGRVDGDFDPPAAGVEPGASSLIRLKVHATRLQWERRSRTVQFTIDADQPGAPTASAPVTFVQASMIPERLFARLLAVAVTHRRARRRVVRASSSRPCAMPPTTPSPNSCRRRSRPRQWSSRRRGLRPTTRFRSPPWSAPPQDVVDKGRCSASCWCPRRLAGLTQSATVDVPAGSTFQLTDFALQNPDKDSGSPCC